MNWTSSQPQGNLHARGEYKQTKRNCHIVESWDWGKKRMLWKQIRRASSLVFMGQKGLPRRRGYDIEP